jgi:hypothetical protein
MKRREMGVGDRDGRPRGSRRPEVRRVEVTTLRKPVAGRTRASGVVTSFVEIPVRSRPTPIDARRRP